MADIRRLQGMLGFAMRAGKLIIGCELVFKALTKKGAVKLVVYSEAASAPTIKKISTKCEFYETTAIKIPLSPNQLGVLLGKTSTPVCIGICDEGFAKEIANAAC